jgi:acyl-coenzyme A thioesterase PaaI-like protein
VRPDEAVVGQRILLPWTRSCWVCGQDNPLGLRARSWKVGDTVQLACTPRREHAGWSDVVHGGFVAMVLDEVMTWAAILGGRVPVFAADVGIRMQEPLGPGTPCTAVARMTRNRRRIIDTEAWLEGDAGRIYARATGRYMPIPAAQASSFHADFVTAPECLDLGAVFGDRDRR